MEPKLMMLGLGTFRKIPQDTYVYTDNHYGGVAVHLRLLVNRRVTVVFKNS